MPHNYLTLVFFTPCYILLPSYPLLSTTLKVSILHPTPTIIPCCLHPKCLCFRQGDGEDGLLQDQKESKTQIPSWIVKALRVFPVLSSPNHRFQTAILSPTSFSDCLGKPVFSLLQIHKLLHCSY